MEQYLPYVSVLVAVLGLYFTTKDNKRTDEKKIEEKAIAQARIDAKLDNLTSLTIEMRGQVSDVMKQQMDFSQKLQKVEESTKSAHKRIDEMKEDMHS